MTPIVSNNHTYTRIYFKSSVKENERNINSHSLGNGIMVDFFFFSLSKSYVADVCYFRNQNNCWF